ncbi:MAG TPA: PAS domain S-box protein [Bryobacteraceae bacterium]|nr:PAS domain S-box protein [Bryobacteraceae bacterium]
MHSAPAADSEFTLLDALSQGVIRVDENWIILYINPAAERLLHLPQGKSLGNKLWDTGAPLPDDFIAHVTKSVDRATVVLEIPGSPERRELEIAPIPQGRLIEIRDLTPVRHAEAALETNQEFLQAVLDNIQAGIVACDETGTLRVFNHITREFHGLAEAPLPPDQWSAHYDLYGADGITPLAKEDIPLYRAFSGEIIRNAEMVIAPKQGPRRSILASGRALIANDGRKLGAVVAMHDITHRKISSRRVRDALRQFRTLFNDAPIAYHEIDRSGIVRRVNRAECRLLERRHEEMIGRPIWEFVPEEDRERRRMAILTRLEGMQPLVAQECEYLTGSGKRIRVELHANLITTASGDIVGIRTAMLDITDRKRREQQTQVLVREMAARELAEASSAELRNILERIGDAYIAFDPEWRYTYVNRKAAELARKPASELIGRSVWDEFPDAVRTPFFSELQRSMREQAPVEFVNHFAPLGKWFENTVYPSPFGVSVFYRDITERVRTQRALELRTAELARKNAELETFASVASHDLQEPLRMIGGYAAMLSKRYSGAIDADADEFIRYITQGVSHMQQLIRDLLTLSRLGAGAEQVHNISIADVVEKACANLDMAISDSRAFIDCQALPFVRFNETRMLQLLQNLIGNAIRYRGGAKPQITIAATREPSGWKVAIQDNGIGFDMQHAEEIFLPYKRLQRGAEPGTGIGLAICKKIVESRGGRIWAQSSPGIGSTFYFTVPDMVQTGE